jgi:hypothetical protein
VIGLGMNLEASTMNNVTTTSASQWFSLGFLLPLSRCSYILLHEVPDLLLFPQPSTLPTSAALTSFGQPLPNATPSSTAGHRRQDTHYCFQVLPHQPGP